jgi:uracil-DNA glycosylase family 4
MVDFQKVIQADRDLLKKRSFSHEIAPASSQLVDFFGKSCSSQCNVEDISLGKNEENLQKVTSTPSEKMEILHSMKEFIRPKLERNLSTKISGGEIISNSDTHHAIRNVELEIEHQTWEDYLHAVNKCHLCQESVFKGSVQQFSGKSFQAPIDVLFVIDRPKDFDTSCFDDSGELNDMDKWQESRQHFFVGEKELMVQRMVQKMNLADEKMVITSIIKCPLQQKSRLKESADICWKNILHEIYFLRPRVIVAFGAWSSEILRGKSEKLSSIHGQFYPLELHVGQEVIESRIVPLFHPDLLFINNDMKRTTWLDMQKIMDYLSSI